MDQESGGARLASFAELDSSPVVEIHLDGRVSYANPAAQRLFPDLPRSGRRHPLIGNFEGILEQLRRGRRDLPPQLRTLGDRLYELRFHLFENAGLVRIYADDVTERERIEDLKEEFLHHVSHELRSPLTAIHQSVQLLLTESAGALNEPQKRFLEIAERNSKFLQQMIEGLLEVTRAETGKLLVDPRRLDLGRLAREVAEDKRLLAEERDLSLSAEIEPGLAPVLADPVRTRQVLINLIDNALKFTPGGGSVSVRVRRDPDSPASLRAEVRDDGPGIEPEPARRIFEKLYQVKSADGGNPSKGLGLGLFIAREIVTRQGGTLSFDSIPGEGSVFYFTLPLFELERFLAPLFEPAAPDNLHLLRVVVFPPGHALSGASARSVLLEARTILQHHLHAADRLLPETAEEDAEGAMYIASASPPAIAAMAARRLEELLAAQHIVKVHWLQPKAEAIAVGYDAKGNDALSRAAAAVWGVIEGTRPVRP